MIEPVPQESSCEDEPYEEVSEVATPRPVAPYAKAAYDTRDIYSFWAYLTDHWLALLSCALSMATIGCIAVALQLGGHATILLMAIVFVSWAVPLVVDFCRQHRFYKNAYAIIAANPKPLLSDVLIEPSRNLNARATHELLEVCLTRVRNETTLQRKNHEQYRTYIEQWIHEIKTPIAASKLLIGSLHGEQAMTLKGEIERIESQVELALYAARSTNLERDYTIREESLLALVQLACRTNMCLLIARGVTLKFSIDEALCVLTDKQWCCFMISQIVVNAAKYDAHCLTFSAWEEDIDTTQGRCILEISDDGCGIPAADVPRVFEYGFVGEVGKAHGSATGMGLYLVGLMAGKLGCGVLLASEEGVGTRVRFSFPRDDRQKTAQKLQSLLTPSKQASTSQGSEEVPSADLP